MERLKLIRKIAVVDDLIVVRNFMQRMLNDFHYEVELFSNGQQLLEALKQENEFDLIITDLLMPVMSGRQLVEEIKQDSKYDEMGIIIYSGVYGEEEVADLLDPRTKFIKKPFKLRTLERLVESMDVLCVQV